MKNAKNLWTLLPTFGILIFLGMSVYSTSLYPGGSQADANSVGFDWANNFWCNLMAENGVNGLKNRARPIAVFASIILSLSMILFFFHFAKHFVKDSVWKNIIKVTGTISMSSAIFIFTKFHDIMTTLLSVFGVVVIIGIIRTLHKNNMTFFKISGIACMIFVVINNLFYYNENFIAYLPLIQKFSFILILAWTVGLNLKMINQNVPQHGI